MFREYNLWLGDAETVFICCGFIITKGQNGDVHLNTAAFTDTFGRKCYSSRILDTNLGANYAQVSCIF